MKAVSHTFRARRCAVLAAGVSLAVLGSAPAFAQAAQPAEEDAIVVTGFRQSLDAALDVKRDSTTAVDVIVAEDIAKFPDQNLAESLQRIPGVAIQRDAGEGRAITVRGLGAQFTRVRVNGMETISTSQDGASANRERGFDFNVFASELFSSLVVNKTASAALDEGSLGAVVDLNTGNPLGGKPGLTVVASVQGRYNDLAKDVDPRVAGLIAWSNDDQTFGIAASVAWSKYTTLELGNNSVRWTQNPFRSVNGVTCMSGSNLLATAPQACRDVALAFHPRIPRYGQVQHDRERLGATASLQFRPSDSTEISIDGLYSNFKATRDETWGEMFRDQERNIDVSNYVIDSNNNLVSASLSNIQVRTERYHRESETEFYQISGHLKQSFGDNLTFNLLAGISQSTAEIPVETTIIFDQRNATGYSYDYSDMEFPRFTFGPGIDNPASFTFTEYRDRPSDQTNKFKNVSGDLGWQMNDDFKLTVGGFYRQFDFDTIGYDRTRTISLPVTTSISELFTLGNAGQPNGNTNTWLVPNLDAAAALVDLYNQPAVLQQGQQREVTEKTYGTWFQADFKGEIFGLRFNGNAGVRYAKTDQRSRGFLGGQFVTVERTYDDFLPAANINFFPTDNIIVRFAAAKVLTRPNLGAVTPGGSVNQFGTIGFTSGNPYLEPYRATTYDAAIEYYFAPGAIVSAAFFAKDIESFPLSSTRFDTFAASGFPATSLTPGSTLYCVVVQDAACPAGSYNPDQLVQYNTTINGGGANLQGVELALQLPFSVFSDSLSSFGFLGNMTFVNSDVDYSINGPRVMNSTNTGLTNAPTTIYTRPLLGLAKRSWNATVYYDDGTFSVRSSVAYRSSYNDGTSGNNNIFEGYGSSLNVDASIRYKFSDSLEVSLEGTNLTDDYRYRYADDIARRNYENNHYGRTFLFGVRYKM